MSTSQVLRWASSKYGNMASLRLGDGLDVLAQHLHEIGDLLAQGALVDGGDLAVGNDHPSIDDDGFDAAPAFGEHDLPRDAVERNE